MTNAVGIAVFQLVFRSGIYIPALGDGYYRTGLGMRLSLIHIFCEERKVIELANEAGDDVTADLMTGYLKDQEKMVWMLVAFSTKSCTK